MTVLTEHETQELQRKIERLSNALATPGQGLEWEKQFRIDTDLQSIKSLLSQKRSCLSYSHLPDWQQNEILAALAQVETSSYVFCIVKESVERVLKSTMDEIWKGQIFTGPSGAALQAAVDWIDKKDILNAVYQRASLEALDSEEAIKKHIVAAFAGLVQRDMIKSVDNLPGY